jgi:hypothetical protein
MASPLRSRPFKLLGYRFVRGVFDERPVDEGSELYLVVVPHKPVDTGQAVESRTVVELQMIIGIVKDGPVNATDPNIEDTLFGSHAVLAAKCVAGYVAKEKKANRDLSKFDDMLQHAVEQLYQVVRAKAISIAADSGFDASDIPVEIDVDNLFRYIGEDEPPRPSKAVRKKASKP